MTAMIWAPPFPYRWLCRNQWKVVGAGLLMQGARRRQKLPLETSQELAITPATALEIELTELAQLGGSDGEGVATDPDSARIAPPFGHSHLQRIEQDSSPSNK